MEQYLAIVQVSHSSADLIDETRIMYASTFFYTSAPVWWFTVVQEKIVSTNGPDLKKMVTAEFVPPEHVRRSRDKHMQVETYGLHFAVFSDFRNTILTM